MFMGRIGVFDGLVGQLYQSLDILFQFLFDVSGSKWVEDGKFGGGWEGFLLLGKLESKFCVKDQLEGFWWS